ncbi:hypothetical protein SBC2_01440 [Caballeronia sp. SBC2]|nr:hypothetical protein SBC2_01440 [Caballeronia sp. SBC2]
MSSVHFVEVARMGNQPVVEVGHMNVKEVVVSQPHRGARLRVFARCTHGQSAAPLSMATISLSFMNKIARPDSEVRNLLTQLRAAYPHGEQLLFFKVKDVNAGSVEHVHVNTWRELEPLWTASLDHALWLTVDGTHNDVVKLLDTIREQDADDSDDSEPAKISPRNSGDAHQAAIDFRNELLAKNWPDGKRVAEMAATGSVSNPHQYAARLRSNGELLGVWVATERAYRHPDFQFDIHGALRAEVAKLLSVLPRNEEDRGGWRRAFWLYSPHSLVDDKIPAEVFSLSPQLVINAAKQQFGGELDDHW